MQLKEGQPKGLKSALAGPNWVLSDKNKRLAENADGWI
jgi:hypothetical protein